MLRYPEQFPWYILQNKYWLEDWSVWSTHELTEGPKDTKQWTVLIRSGLTTRFPSTSSSSKITGEIKRQLNGSQWRFRLQNISASYLLFFSFNIIRCSTVATEIIESSHKDDRCAKKK